MFSGSQNPTPPTVFNNLQASEWVYCEDETGEYTNYLGILINVYFFLQIFKVVYFTRKKSSFQKIS